MRAEQWPRARVLFQELCEAPAGARAGRLGEVAAEDRELARLLERLLAADATDSGILERGAAADLADVLAELAEDRGEEPAAAPDARLGPWRLLERLGTGGMGEVWLAERADGAYERQVAIKLLKRGMDSEQVLARFRREREILARLEHPSIAGLLDAGTAADGRPYLVMERVEGRALTEHCQTSRLGVEARLALVLEVCEAVEYAHRNLVVHRDLKPSNILVTDSGGLKLLDFGIAKLLAETEDARLTATELRVLTPSYAAPEQILGRPVTTATDVYCLGIVLYELLTGRLPHRRSAASATSLAAEVERESVERPSTAVRRATAAQAADLPAGPPERLARRLGGDLDTIVLKALAREPERRYGSVAALAEDLRRHLAGQPIKARPDKLRYRAGKFVRRHRVGVAAAGLAAASLLAGLAVALWQASVARDEAVRAEAQARRAERVKELLVSVFQQSDPHQALGRPLTALEVLEAGRERVRAELAAEPEVQAELFAILAQVYANQGSYELARDLASESVAIRRRLHPAGDQRIGPSLATLGGVLVEQDLFDEAQPILEEAVRLLANAPQREARLARARAQGDLAEVARSAGAFDEGIAMLERSHASFRELLGPGHYETAQQLSNLAVALEDGGRYAEARLAYEEALARLASADPRDPLVAEAHAHLAGILDRLGERQAAGEHFERALAIQREVLGERHDDVAETLYSYGIFLIGSGRPEEALQAFEEADGVFLPESYHHAHCQRYAGLALIGLGRYVEAEDRLREAVRAYRRTLGEGEAARALADLGTARQKQGDLAQAERFQREGIAGIEVAWGPESYQVARPLEQLGETLRLAGRLEEAIAVHRRCLAVTRKVLGEDHARAGLAARQLALDLLARGASGDRDEARGLLETARSILREKSPQDPLLPDIESRLAQL